MTSSTQKQQPPQRQWSGRQLRSTQTTCSAGVVFLMLAVVVFVLLCETVISSPSSFVFASAAAAKSEQQQQQENVPFVDDENGFEMFGAQTGGAQTRLMQHLKNLKRKKESEELLRDLKAKEQDVRNLLSKKELKQAWVAVQEALDLARKHLQDMVLLVENDIQTDEQDEATSNVPRYPDAIFVLFDEPAHAALTEMAFRFYNALGALTENLALGKAGTNSGLEKPLLNPTKTELLLEGARYAIEAVRLARGKVKYILYMREQQQKEEEAKDTLEDSGDDNKPPVQKHQLAPPQPHETELQHLVRVGSLLTLANRKCLAVKHAYLPLYYHYAQQNVTNLGGGNAQRRFFLVAAMAKCHPDTLGMHLWKEMHQSGHLLPEKKGTSAGGDSGGDGWEARLWWGNYMITHVLAHEAAVAKAAAAGAQATPNATNSTNNVTTTTTPNDFDLQTVFDKLNLSKRTPYRHAYQTPRIFNAQLLTKEPQPYLDPPHQFAACRAMKQHKRDILREYKDYMAQGGNHTIVHPDVELTFDYDDDDDKNQDHQQEVSWQPLFLKRTEAVEMTEDEEDESMGDGKVGWQEALCQYHFPITCRIFKEIREVSKPLPSSGPYSCSTLPREQQQWCTDVASDNPDDDSSSPPPQQQSQQSAGGVAFYKLTAGSRLRLHNGATNQRLKCHLVVQAPPAATSTTSNNDGTGRAWMEVGGQRRNQTTGDVIAFDDSYLHRVGNDHETMDRVILDVTFFHPKLFLTAAKTKEEDDDNGDANNDNTRSSSNNNKDTTTTAGDRSEL